STCWTRSSRWPPRAAGWGTPRAGPWARCAVGSSPTPASAADPAASPVPRHGDRPGRARRTVLVTGTGDDGSDAGSLREGPTPADRIRCHGPRTDEDATRPASGPPEARTVGPGR